MLAILPDIHANRQALEAVLADAVSRGATRFAALGDIIGFGGDPTWCTQRMRELGAVALHGNHEAALLHPDLFAAIPSVEHMAAHTAHLLPPEHLVWLTSLPLTEEAEGLPLTHASFHAPEHWGRLNKPAEAVRSFAAQGAPLALFGHTHRPTLFCRDSGGQVKQLPITYDAEGSYRLQTEPDKRYLVNPGSVGQPRDGDPRAAYALWDVSRHSLTLRRVHYATEQACAGTLRMGLPAAFADALRQGISPL